MKELGYPFVFDSPFGIAGPKGMDPKVVAKLHDAFKKAIEEPALLETLAKYDMVANYKSTEDYRKFVDRADRVRAEGGRQPWTEQEGELRRGFQSVIASAAKQSSFTVEQKLDCFVATLLAMTEKRGSDDMTNLTATGGVPGPGRIGRVAIGDLLKRAAARFPDRIAVDRRRAARDFYGDRARRQPLCQLSGRRVA